MSDYDKVQRFIEEHHYIPETTMDNLVVMILLRYDGACEDEDRDIPIEEYLSCFFEYGTFRDFDWVA